MELTVREVATLLGRSARTVRAQVARGDIPATKRGGQWVVQRRSLPLTDAQRTALQAKADSIRHAVDEALPSRMARAHADRRRSVADLDAFRLGADLLRRVRTEGTSTLEPRLERLICAELEAGLLALAVAVHLYEPAAKLAQLHRVRLLWGRVVGRLLLASPVSTPAPVAEWLLCLECEVLPAVSGFARWADRLDRDAGRRRS
jgi:excisionase family DNA binding protein